MSPTSGRCHGDSLRKYLPSVLEGHLDPPDCPMKWRLLLLSQLFTPVIVTTGSVRHIVSTFPRGPRFRAREALDIPSGYITPECVPTRLCIDLQHVSAYRELYLITLVFEERNR